MKFKKIGFERIAIELLTQEESDDWEKRIEDLYNSLIKDYKLSHKKAVGIIWYLQEITGIIPSCFEFCSVCKDLYDSYRGGYHSEINGKCYCEADRYNNGEIAFCEDCNEEVPIKKYSKQHEAYLCDGCRKKRRLIR